MAFDQPTRSRLARFVGDARALLTEEFTRQFQQEYGIDPANGEVADLDTKLGHLDDTRRATAQLLRETAEHYQPGFARRPAKERYETLDRIVREQAFTVLNRLCALRMAEARGLLIESVGRGPQSKGFQLFTRLAGPALGETGDAYRTYLFSLFDELAVDLPVLFDRFAPEGRLFPGEATLLRLLAQINHPEIEGLWAEDETVGWVYQYFNSKEERQAMRAESVAPRNSRELAVRNQFFTPRYVVEFLADNTLGRTWYEMTSGETGLVDSCRYLVRRPNEVFLDPGHQPPAQAEPAEGLSQEELVRQPVYIPHRPLKDPRNILMLDPACGSMHFGLYAFDLFERIYEEAWEIEAERGPKALERAPMDAPLHEAYPDKEVYLRNVPQLIVERNIHGVDIDPRAAQIAALALWLRAQRSWRDRAVKPQDRPEIRRSNVVCAEPMPGDPAMLNEFIGQHLVRTPEDQVIGEMLSPIFKAMELAGEAGSLLKIEEEIASVIEAARRKYEQALLKRRKEADYLPGFAPERDTTIFDLLDLPNAEEFWQQAEERIYAALRAYAEDTAGGGGYRRRLFADDAAQGFAFIDLCRRRYDVMLMNPPFGEFSRAWKSEATKFYPNSSNDLLGAMIETSLKRLHQNSIVGAITSRTCFFLTSFTKWRENVVLKQTSLLAVADLGQNVMDDAMVEAAAYILRNHRQEFSTPFIRAVSEIDREGTVNVCVEAIKKGIYSNNLYWASQARFCLLPDSPFVYWVEEEDLRILMSHSPFEPSVGQVRVGVQTGDDPRFVRLVWETKPEDSVFVYYPMNGQSLCRFDDPIVSSYLRRKNLGVRCWAFHVKSGASQPWYSPITMKLKYEDDGAEMRAFRDEKGKPRAFLRSADFYFRSGFSWTRRAPRFYPYVVPSGCIPSVSRYMAFPTEGREIEALGVVASRIASAFMRFYGEKFEWPNFLVETVKMLPWPKLDRDTLDFFSMRINEEVHIRRSAYQNHEPFHEFLVPIMIYDYTNEGKSLLYDSKSLLGEEGERRIAQGYDLTKDRALRIEHDVLEVIEYRQKITSQSYLTDSKETEDDSDFVLSHSIRAQHEALLSYVIGCIYGRWDIRYATGERPAPALPDPFAPLPVCPPGMLQNAQGLPATPEDVPASYPLRISWQGTLVDDEGHREGIESRVREGLQVIWGERAEVIEQEACEILGVRSLREYFRRPASFFAEHLARYSKSRRQAPIYWPLSTPSGSYTLWLYYHRLTAQTLYSCVNDFVEPKLAQVRQELAWIAQHSSGGSVEAREVERLGNLESELKELRAELLRVAAFWKPNLNDGVQITAAPLWRLFQHKPWQKKLKETWESLERGDYDWAHLAYSIWPERVREKCKTDKSLAIAHRLEELYVEAPTAAKKRGGRGKKAEGASRGMFDEE